MKDLYVTKKEYDNLICQSEQARILKNLIIFYNLSTFDLEKVVGAMEYRKEEKVDE